MTNEMTITGLVSFQERNGRDYQLTTYTRGLGLSGTLWGAGLPRQCGATAGGIGGLLARSDKLLFTPIVLPPSNPDPQYVNTTYYHSLALALIIMTLLQTRGWISVAVA